MLLKKGENGGWLMLYLFISIPIEFDHCKNCRKVIGYIVAKSIGDGPKYIAKKLILKIGLVEYEVKFAVKPAQLQ